MSKNKYSVKNLKTDNLVNPIGIDSKNPVFSWNVANTEKATNIPKISFEKNTI